MEDIPDPKKGKSFMEEMHGTNYPYFIMDDAGMFKKSFGKIKQTFSSINPFALQQIPSNKRLAFAPNNGTSFYSQDPLPNPVKYQTFLPIHYDPLSESKFEVKDPKFETISPTSRS